jgi:uncharacterized protein (TIGR03790 family)
VVNSRSWSSRTVANHYAQLRQIPTSNIFHLDWSGSLYETTLESFRDRLLKPVYEAIDARQLAAQIDYIVYSTDFPYLVDFSSGASAGDRFPAASLTGMTYLSSLSSATASDFRALNTNRYALGSLRGGSTPSPRAFRSTYHWNAARTRVPQGQTYVLSTMLGFSSGRGNSVEEIVHGLSRSAAADATRPKGTIYFVNSGDPHRSGTRAPGFEPAVKELAKLDVRAEIIGGAIPQGRRDVLGAMLGISSFQWDGATTPMLPGAIAENLTSFGGVLKANATQTPLTVLMRAGAAGSSGTVIEPYAVAQKFPDPVLYVCYAAGCSLAESFYQSVEAPYQLLVVGDALCQPWSRTATVSVKELRPHQRIQGTIELTPTTQSAGAASWQTESYHLFINGRLVAINAPDKPFQLDTTTLPDGHHELRIVAVDDSATECQSRIILPVIVDNQARLPQANVLDLPPDKIPLGATLRISLQAPGAARILVFDGRRSLGQLSQEQGTVDVATDQLGMGPVQLQVIAIYRDGKHRHALGSPIHINIIEPAAVSGKSRLPAGHAAGLLLTREDRSTTVLSDMSAGQLARAGVAPDATFQLEGYVEAEQGGMYQLHLTFEGKLQLKINGQRVYRGEHRNVQRVGIPVHLEQGWHELELSGKLDSVTEATAEFGSRGTRTWDNKRFFCRMPPTP